MDELVDLLLSDLSVLAHMLQSIVDQVLHLLALQGSTLVLVIAIKDSVHGVPKVLV